MTALALAVVSFALACGSLTIAVYQARRIRHLRAALEQPPQARPGRSLVELQVERLGNGEQLPIVYPLSREPEDQDRIRAFHRALLNRQPLDVAPAPPASSVRDLHTS